ncbi:protein of unknown function [Sterolibacterium denitrificans]|uniref:Uncharacterized protein n=1 Tax=Sterolibacterium denitrificans TaxID=157592 RepID=A0A7Z7HRW0_9PROT|nr:protein of unknown function [Sterolibacterium denitrificans]
MAPPHIWAVVRIAFSEIGILVIVVILVGWFRIFLCRNSYVPVLIKFLRRQRHFFINFNASILST